MAGQPGSRGGWGRHRGARCGWWCWWGRSLPGRRSRCRRDGRSNGGRRRGCPGRGLRGHGLGCGGRRSFGTSRHSQKGHRSGGSGSGGAHDRCSHQYRCGRGSHGGRLQRSRRFRFIFRCRGGDRHRHGHGYGRGSWNGHDNLCRSRSGASRRWNWSAQRGDLWSVRRNGRTPRHARAAGSRPLDRPGRGGGRSERSPRRCHHRAGGGAGRRGRAWALGPRGRGGGFARRRRRGASWHLGHRPAGHRGHGFSRQGGTGFRGKRDRASAKTRANWGGRLGWTCGACASTGRHGPGASPLARDRGSGQMGCRRQIRPGCHPSSRGQIRRGRRGGRSRTGCGSSSGSSRGRLRRGRGSDGWLRCCHRHCHRHRFGLRFRFFFRRGGLLCRLTRRPRLAAHGRSRGERDQLGGAVPALPDLGITAFLLG